MKELYKDFNIVIAGKWNPALVTGKWLIETITSCQEYKMEDLKARISLNADIDNFQSISYKVRDDFYFTCTPSRLTFNTEKIEQYTKLTIILAEIVKTLEHTPYQAYGVNFYFQLPYNEIIPTKLNDFFTLALEDKVPNYDITTVDYHKRIVNLEKEMVLLFNYSPNVSQITITVNVNFNITNNVKMQEIISKNSIEALKKEILTLLETSYNLSLDDGD